MKKAALGWKTALEQGGGVATPTAATPGHHNWETVNVQRGLGSNVCQSTENKSVFGLETFVEDL